MYIAAPAQSSLSSSYQVFIHKHPSMLISPCHERFGCAHLAVDRRVCGRSCVDLKIYRKALAPLLSLPTYGVVDTEDEYAINLECGPLHTDF